MQNEIMPAVLVESIEEFVERIQTCEDFAETVQWDVMDGQFVDNVTFNDAAATTGVDTVLNIEAHLMVENPLDYLEPMAMAGIDRVVVHVEALEDVDAFVAKMDKYDFQKGLAISPETPLSVIESVAGQLDEVLVMTVNPGEAGQRFLPSALEKVKVLRKKYPNLNIAVDGGINAETIVAAKEAGANRFAVNSAVFQTPDPANAFEVLQAKIS